MFLSFFTPEYKTEKMSQKSKTSENDQTLPSYSHEVTVEVSEPKSSSQKSQDSKLSQEHEEMSSNQAVLTQAYKSQETSQQKSQNSGESSQLRSQLDSQASSVATPSQADKAIQGLISTVVEHVEAAAQTEPEVSAGSQTTSQSQTEKSTQ